MGYCEGISEYFYAIAVDRPTSLVALNDDEHYQ